MSLAYRKFGKDLGCDIKLKDGKAKRVSIFLAENFKKINITKGANNYKDPFNTLGSILNGLFPKPKLLQPCVISGSHKSIVTRRFLTSTTAKRVGGLAKPPILPSF